jgi:4-oxalocrotonate tautomerase
LKKIYLSSRTKKKIDKKKFCPKKTLRKKISMEVIFMPVITVDAPSMSKEQKRDLVRSFAESASQVMNLPVSAMVIIIREVESENVGLGNILLCDRE